MSSSRSLFTHFASLVISLAIILGGLFFVSNLSAQGAGNFYGWVWSDNIGWISLNCINTGDCSTSNYVVSRDAGGVMSGYAYSENIGWISFSQGDLAGCPSGACTASFVSNSLKGWARACSVFQSGCSGALETDVSLGGWDGWISLSKQASDAQYYGASFLGKRMLGFAWGGDILGWLDFAPQAIYTVPQCLNQIDDDSDGKIDYPADPGCTDQFDNSELDISSAECGDGLDNDGDGRIDHPIDPGCTSITDDSEADRVIPVTVDLKVNNSDGPLAIADNSSVVLTWVSTGATSCQALFDWSGNKALENSTGVSVGPLTNASTFAIECINPYGVVASDVVVVNLGVSGVSPTVDLKLNASDAPANFTAGASGTLTWTSTNAASCFGTGDWSGNKTTSNGVGVSTGALKISKVYYLTCTSLAGLETTDRVVALVASSPVIPQCSNGVDDDGDTKTDYTDDPGCTDLFDNDEQNSAGIPECRDTIDNDSDGAIDYPADLGCESGNDDSEVGDGTGGVCEQGVSIEGSCNQCSDGIDNNDAEDTLADTDDPGCHLDGNATNEASYSPIDNDEGNTGTLTGDCKASPLTVSPNDSVVWTASNLSGGSGVFAFEWTGTDIPVGPAPDVNPYTTSYTTTGSKVASVKVSSAGQTATLDCGNVIVATMTSAFSLTKTRNIELVYVSGSGNVSSPTTIKVVPENGFSSDVVITVDSMSPGLVGKVIPVFTKSGVTSNSSMTLSPSDYECNGGGLCRGVEFKINASEVITGAHTITIKGSSVGLDRTEKIQLNIVTKKLKFEEI